MLRILSRVAERVGESLPEGGGVSTPSGSGRDIDTFGALQKSLRTAAIASLKDAVAEGSFALGMPRGRSRANPASPEGKAGGDSGVDGVMRACPVARLFGFRRAPTV